MKFRNLSELFWRRCDKYRDKVFLRYKTRLRNPLEDITWHEAGKQIEAIAHGLKAIGVERGDNVCLLAATCHYWPLCDLGIICSGASTVPIYHSSTKDTVEYIVNHCEAEVVFVRNKIQLQKLRASWDKLPKLRYAVVILDKGDLPEHDPRIITLDQLVQLGLEQVKKDPDFIARRRKEVTQDDVASIIYTSGTTGTPKGVVITHRSILTAALAFYEYVPLDDGQKILSFLPLAHVFERVASQFYGIDQGAVFTYCEKVEYMPELLVESKCEVMMVVPRMLEKMYSKIKLQISQQAPFKRMMMDEAIKLGTKYHRARLHGAEIDKWLEARYELAKTLVLDKIKERLAPHLKVFVVGGAPMSEEIIYFFLSIGIDVVEGYGLTETTCAISVNPPWGNKPGTVGLPFKHFDVRIAEDGEILCKGNAIFREYYKDPETTAEVLKDGWFHTGDIGEFDDDGYLKITGRKKDLIITASGKNVTPARVENLIKRSPYINQIVVLGDRERYLAAIITLSKEEIHKYMEQENIQLHKGQKLSEYDEIQRLIKGEIQENSLELSSFEQIKKFHILDHELTISAGEVTPTLKIRRNVIRERYADIVKELFRKENAQIK